MSRAKRAKVLKGTPLTMACECGQVAITIKDTSTMHQDAGKHIPAAVGSAILTLSSLVCGCSVAAGDWKNLVIERWGGIKIHCAIPGRDKP